MIYLSCLFSRNRSEVRKLAKQLSRQFPDSKIALGGSGINLSTELLPEIENIFPDYNLYPEINYSIGYTSRGCPRSCGFCLVPKMKWEGKPHASGDIYQFYNPKFRKMIILDNNIFAIPHNHFRKIAKQIIKEKIQVVEFTSGLDIRILDDEKASLLKKMHISSPKFSWDNIADEFMVMRGIEILRRNGINRSVFYILVGYDSTYAEDLYRVEKLKSVGQLAYVMRYETVRHKREYIDLAMWVNQFHLFSKMTFDEFKAKRKSMKKHVENSA